MMVLCNMPKKKSRMIGVSVFFFDFDIIPFDR